MIERLNNFSQIGTDPSSVLSAERAGTEKNNKNPPLVVVLLSIIQRRSSSRR
jgi:hypothetical protein